MLLLKSFVLLSVHWLVRILGILFILLVSIFAFDVFGQGAGFWRTLGAFLMHMIPSFILIAVFIISLRWGWIGSFVFILAGIAYLFWQYMKYPIIYVPMFVVGVLFFFDWLFRDPIRKLREEIR